MSLFIKKLIKFLFKDNIVEIIKETMEEGFKVGKHSIYLRPSYIDMNGNELRNIAGNANGDTYVVSVSGSTYYAKNCSTGIVTTNSVFSSLMNTIIGLMTNGGIITIKEGSFTATAKISLANNISIYGTKGTKIYLGYNGTLFELQGDSDCVIEGLYLDGVKDSYGSSTGIVITGSSHRNIISHNYLNNFGSQGIYIQIGCNYNTVSENIIEDTDDEGIFISRADNNSVIKNKVINTGLHAIIVSGGSYNIIDGNDVYGAGTNYANNAYGDEGFAHGIAIDGNAGNNACYGNRVVNNIIRNTYNAGIEIADYAHHTVVSNNYVYTTGNGGTVNQYGIYVGGWFKPSNDCIISNNQVFDAHDRGIYISGSNINTGTYTPFDTERVIVTGNVVRACTAPSGEGEGIYLKLCDYILVENNQCTGNTGYGLGFEFRASGKSDYCNIIGNDFSGNSLGAGIFNSQNSNGICTLNVGGTFSA